MNTLDIIARYYVVGSPLYQLLLTHSQMVCQKALDILSKAPSAVREAVDETTVVDGAMLHDIGIVECDAPSILCCGQLPYIRHGVVGARMLRSLPSVDPQMAAAVDIEACARICERHTGSGLTADDIARQHLPLPEGGDYVPVTLEEQLVCLADKFFSKSGDPRAEKPLERVRSAAARFGGASLDRLDAMCAVFGVAG